MPDLRLTNDLLDMQVESEMFTPVLSEHLPLAGAVAAAHLHRAFGSVFLPWLLTGDLRTSTDASTDRLSILSSRRLTHELQTFTDASIDRLLFFLPGLLAGKLHRFTDRPAGKPTGR